MTTPHYDAVTDFHNLIGVVPRPCDIGQAVLRSRLILEEYAETFAALQELNLTETADGLADLHYVIIGTAIVYNVPPDDVQLHEPRFARALLYSDTVAFTGLLSAVNVVIYQLAHPAIDIAGVHSSLSHLDRRVFDFAHSIGVPLARVFTEVHKSNMTKSARNTGSVSKYGSSAKGPGYVPPDIAGVLARYKEECSQCNS